MQKGDLVLCWFDGLAWSGILESTEDNQAKVNVPIFGVFVRKLLPINAVTREDNQTRKEQFAKYKPAREFAAHEW